MTWGTSHSPWPNNYGVRLYKTGGQNILTGTRTAIIWDTEVRDDGGFWTVSPNPTRVTIPPGGAGWYQLSGGVRWGAFAAAATTTVRQAEIRLNGTTLIAIDGMSGFTANVQVYNQPSTAWYLNAGEYAELTVFHDDTSTRGIESGLQFSPWMSVIRGGIG